MPIPPSAQALWRAYTAAIGMDRCADFYEAFHFHDNEAGAQELAQLVLAGRKRATAGLAWACAHDGRQPPRPGSLSVMTDWHGTPLAIIETRTVDTVAFEDVDAAFAAAEGEGDGSLAYWRQVHQDYFGRECRRIGRAPDPRMPVLCERFELVFRA